MKLKEIEATVRIQDDSGKPLGEIKSKAKYDEPETINEFLNMKSLSQDDKLRIILYGLNTFHQAKLRKSDDISKAAKHLCQAVPGMDFATAYNQIVAIQRAQATAREKVNPAA